MPHGPPAAPLPSPPRNAVFGADLAHEQRDASDFQESTRLTMRRDEEDATLWDESDDSMQLFGAFGQQPQQQQQQQRRSSTSAAAATTIAISSDPVTRRPSSKESLDAEQLNTKYLWSLLFATMAECLTTCYVPEWTYGLHQLNVSATFLNLLGPFMDGVSYALEEFPKFHQGSIALLCLEFRSSFLGVFTSYSFMVDHAGDLSTKNIVAGPLYVCLSIIGACASFQFGRTSASRAFAKYRRDKYFNINRLRVYPSFLFYVTTFIALTTLLAIFGPRGFVRDPTDPQFVGNIQVKDGEELMLGIFMSCSGILLGNMFAEKIDLEFATQQLGTSSKIAWGTFVCNFVSVLLTLLAYRTNKLLPKTTGGHLLVSKFVSSFCGSVSCFSASISHIMLMWQSGNRNSAMWNFLMHVLLGLMFLPYLNKV